MTRLSSVLTCVAVLAVLACRPTAAQPPSERPRSVAASDDLQQYEGRYAYRDDVALYLVAHRDRLVAVLGDGKYPLRRVASDLFENGAGDRIPMRRDADRRVVAFEERGETFRRVDGTVPDEVRGLLEPRPDASRYTYATPGTADDGIAVRPAGDGTLPVAIAEQIVQGVIDGRYADVRSVLVYHRGALRLEEYFYGFDRARPHPMRSLTKTVIALLAGIAVDQQAVRADAPIWPDLGTAPGAHADPRKAAITLHHLLSNQTGLACDDHDADSPGNETRLYDAADWVQAFADLPVLEAPGTSGRYCSFGILTAGRLVERTVRAPLADFAQRALFDPIGVRRADWRWTFTLDRSQRHEFGQVYLRPRDMLKLGVLLQQRGQWAGRQVVSAAWADRMTARQARVDDSDYGLGIWHRWYHVKTPTGDRRVDTLMMSGNGGQKVYIVPSADLIVVFTGGAFNAESPTNEIMSRVLLPALVP